jgi:heme A synthase
MPRDVPSLREEGQNLGLHRFALFTACCTAFLIFVGGLVTSTESGLAVPDWPLSYGMLFPPMVGGIFYEHGHRMVASFVGLLTVILAIWTWRRETRAWVRRLSLAALAAVILQGLLGGLTVLYLLPTPISMTHACLAQTFFCMTVETRTAIRSTPDGNADPADTLHAHHSSRLSSTGIGRADAAYRLRPCDTRLSSGLRPHLTRLCVRRYRHRLCA